MFIRVLPFLLMLFFITSCDKFSFSKGNSNQVLDTVVDFSSVDTYPSFKPCDSIINKTEKSSCFRTTIHNRIGEELQKHKFAITDAIDEIVYVDLIIDAKGVILVDSINASYNIKNRLPKLDSLLKLSIENIPTSYPAIKRGIPVSTKYRLPIRIKL